MDGKAQPWPFFLKWYLANVEFRSEKAFTNSLYGTSSKTVGFGYIARYMSLIPCNLECQVDFKPISSDSKLCKPFWTWTNSTRFKVTHKIDQYLLQFQYETNPTVAACTRKKPSPKQVNRLVDKNPRKQKRKYRNWGDNHHLRLVSFPQDSNRDLIGTKCTLHPTYSSTILWITFTSL